MEDTIRSDLNELKTNFNNLKEYKTMLSDISKDLNGLMASISGGSKNKNSKRLKINKRKSRRLRKSKKSRRLRKSKKSRKLRISKKSRK